MLIKEFDLSELSLTFTEHDDPRYLKKTIFHDKVIKLEIHNDGIVYKYLNEKKVYTRNCAFKVLSSASYFECEEKNGIAKGLFSHKEISGIGLFIYSDDGRRKPLCVLENSPKGRELVEEMSNILNQQFKKYFESEDYFSYKKSLTNILDSILFYTKESSLTYPFFKNVKTLINIGSSRTLTLLDDNNEFFYLRYQNVNEFLLKNCGEELIAFEHGKNKSLNGYNLEKLLKELKCVIFEIKQIESARLILDKKLDYKTVSILSLKFNKEFACANHLKEIENIEFDHTKYNSEDIDAIKKFVDYINYKDVKNKNINEDNVKYFENKLVKYKERLKELTGYDKVSSLFSSSNVELTGDSTLIILNTEKVLYFSNAASGILSNFKKKDINSDFDKETIIDEEGYDISKVIKEIENHSYDMYFIKDLKIIRGEKKTRESLPLSSFMRKPSKLKTALHESIYGTAATINKELERNRTHIETYYEASIVNIILGEPYDGKVLSFKLSEEKIVKHLSVLEGITQKIEIKNRESEKANIKLDDADIFERIKKLKELYDLNIISEEEFEVKKTELLKKV